MIRKKTIPENSFAGLLIVLLFLLFSCNNPDEEKSVPFISNKWGVEDLL
jgi:hypothetical protein